MTRRQDTFDLRAQLQYGDDDTHLGQTQLYSSDEDLELEMEQEMEPARATRGLC